LRRRTGLDQLATLQARVMPSVQSPRTDPTTQIPIEPLPLQSACQAVRPVIRSRFGLDKVTAAFARPALNPRKLPARGFSIQHLRLGLFQLPWFSAVVLPV